MSTHKPWEERTINRLTLNEMMEWVEWYVTYKVTHGHPTDQIVHNLLLWERTRVERLGEKAIGNNDLE